MIAAVALSMRLIAHEREKGTLVLINTAPVRDVEIVAGKFLALFTFLAGVTLAHRVHAAAHLRERPGLDRPHPGRLPRASSLLAAATIAIGLFASALAKTQVVAAILGAVILGIDAPALDGRRKRRRPAGQRVSSPGSRSTTSGRRRS